MGFKKYIYSFLLSILVILFISACGDSGIENKSDSKVAINYETVYALLSDGSLFAWGSNNYGLLGSGNSTANSDKPVYILGNIKQIFASDNVTFAITYGNSLYAWGNNNFGQTGTGNNAQSINIPTKVNGITGNIKKIYTIDKSAFALTDDGSVYAWGDNTNGMLGLGVSDAIVNTPQKITTINSFIKDLVVNRLKFSVLALTANNSLYAWGDNQYGQLGIGNNNSIVTTPTKVNGFTGNIKQIYTGVYSTYALTEDSSVYTWGSNQNGQLGLGLDNVTVNTPAKVNGITGNIKEIITNRYSVYVLTDDNSLYIWGNNRDGQLGLGKENPVINTPTKIDTFGAVKNVYTAQFATFIVTTDNALYASGANSYGQLGVGDWDDRYAFEKVNGYTGNINKMFSDLYCSYMLTDDNSIYDWGSNSYGELGLGDDVNKFNPQKVNNISGVIKDIFANGAQVYLLMEDDSVYSWGDAGVIDMLGREGVNNEPLKISFIK